MKRGGLYFYVDKNGIRQKIYKTDSGLWKCSATKNKIFFSLKECCEYLGIN